MAVIFTKEATNIAPVYSDLIFELYDAPREHNSDLRYQIDILINGLYLRTSTHFPNIENKVSVNISKILSQFFVSEIFLNSSLYETVSGGIVSYVVTGKSISGGVTETDILNEKYVFNGVADDVDIFTKEDYIITLSAQAKFLNRWNGARKLHVGDVATIQFLQGDFSSGDVSNLTSIDIRVVDKTGAEVITNKALTLTTTPQIVSLDISPSILSAIPGVVIDDDTDYYEITGAGSSTETIKIFVTTEDIRFDRYFRIGYIDLYGAQEYVNFDLVHANALKIKRNVYFNNGIRKTYDISALDRESALSNYLTEVESKNLKELWTSPFLADMTNGMIDRIILESANVPIDLRRNKRLISYVIKFYYSREYRIQRH